ncbi:MAG: hypothetical protein JW819_07160 [Candidatus Krumholzibacteriota bacterium]|nr:hypothetical protein [Candidatus Krumholzibacteriota bacterium]
MRRAILSVLLLLAFALPARAAGEETAYDYGDLGLATDFGGGIESDYLVDSPAAAVLRHGNYRLGCRMMAGGSVVSRAEVGIKDRLAVGVSWGLLNLLGRDDVDSYERTGLTARFLLVEEMGWPALAIGFDNQGYGAWDESRERYERKSKGFYLAGTRSWYGPMGTDVATTVGINYSLETEDEDSPDAFFGLEVDFDRQFALLVDYALGLDDNEDEDPDIYGDGLGWLDLGLRWNVQESVQFKFFFRDLLGNYAGDSTVDRQFLVSYQGSF